MALWGPSLLCLQGLRVGASWVGAVDGTHVLHGSLPVLTEEGTGRVRAGEELEPGRALLAGTCVDELSPDPRARRQDRIPEDSAGCCGT